ncbi:hypothetical protein [Shewanella sp. 10N.286.52.C2]|nr:hypothetical protein [Shewanella sp. 10N.286.52.C2]
MDFGICLYVLAIRNKWAALLPLQYLIDIKAEHLIAIANKTS